jgi:hypothetical protein
MSSKLKKLPPVVKNLPMNSKSKKLRMSKSIRAQRLKLPVKNAAKILRLKKLLTLLHRRKKSYSKAAKMLSLKQSCKSRRTKSSNLSKNCKKWRRRCTRT